MIKRILQLNKITSFIYIVLLCLISFNNFAQSLSPEQLLSELIKIKSVTGTEKKIGLYLSEYCKNQGLNITTFSDNDSSYNFAASIYPLTSLKPNIIFMSHLDVVSEGDISEWTYPPYSGEITDSCVWGRGAIDCKGLAVMQLKAIIENIPDSGSKELAYNITFLAVSGEETGGLNGAFSVSNYNISDLNPVVIFGEGGSGLANFIPSYPEQVVFGISVAEKKALWLKLEARNKTYGHGAAPPALYANKHLLRALIKLLDEKRLIKFGKVARQMFREVGKMEGGIKGFVIKHINWDVFWPLVKKYFEEGEIMHILVYNTFVITNIYNTDIVTNKIADKAYATLDCRLLPETNSKKFIKKIENVVGPKINVSVIAESPGAEPSEDKTIFFKNMEKALICEYPESKVVPILFPATTDNNYFRQHDIPVYGILPIVFDQELIESVHNINERIKIDDLYRGINVYSVFIQSMTNPEGKPKRKFRLIKAKQDR
ncbi:MAG: hypothetical protein A2046_06325 [Bacteroidetes bacterium GWA2_30_7]|nr:MAG: hypothetical protein A2046_06325 [Bacteroidetes bacterium GWA2_30_7]